MMNYGEMTTFKNETEWKAYLQYLETKDTSKDSEGNDPDLFPCMLVHASYHRNNSGRYEWHRTFVYLHEARAFVQEMEFARITSPEGE